MVSLCRRPTSITIFDREPDVSSCRSAWASSQSRDGQAMSISQRCCRTITVFRLHNAYDECHEIPETEVQLRARVPLWRDILGHTNGNFGLTRRAHPSPALQTSRAFRCRRRSTFIELLS